MAISQAQLDIIIKAIAEGQGITQINQQLGQLKQAADTSTQSTGNFSQGVLSLQSALAGLGLVVTGQQLLQFANNAREAARAENDAVNALKVASSGIDDYEKALQLGREATRGMASDQQIAAAQSVLFGAGLANNAQQAAELASAGTILSQVFASAGASQELFVRLLSSGSPVLYNNFGLTAQMVQAKQKEIEASTQLRGEEAKSQALKEILIEQSIRYKDALSQESISAAQAAAAQSNFMASIGELINNLDRATGATDFYTAALNRLTQGAEAWSYVFNEAIPAIQGHEAALASDAAQTILTAQSYDEIAAAVEAAEEDQSAFRDSLLQNVDTHAEYQAAVDKVAQANIQLAGELDMTAEEFTNVKNSMADAVVTSGSWVSSMQAMSISTQAATQAARDLAIAQDNVAAKAKASSATPMTNREADAYRQMAEARGQSVEIQAQFEQEQTRQAEEERRKEADKSAKQMTQSFSQAANQITNSISGAINSLVSSSVSAGDSWVSQALGVDQAGQDRIEEDVRRMAAVAQGGLADVNAAELAAKLSGVKDAVAQAYVQAFSTGDDEKLKAAAKQLALSPIVELYNVEAITQQIETQLRQQRLSQQINDKVNALLGEKGLGAIQQVTQQVQGVVDTTGQAAQQTSAEVTTVGTSAETTGKQISQAFSGAIVQIDILNERFRLMAGLIERVNTLAKSAGGSISGMNPPAAPTNDAANKMGGNSPL